MDATPQSRRERAPSPDQPHPSGRVMLQDFDYLSVAKDIIAGADPDEIIELDAALRARRWELEKIGALEPSGDAEPPKQPVSQLLERRPHLDGELSLERRAYVRKDGTRSYRGPYWYFKYREGSRQKTIYLGKTDEPEAELAEKRARPS